MVFGCNVRYQFVAKSPLSIRGEKSVINSWRKLIGSARVVELNLFKIFYKNVILLQKSFAK